MMMELIGTKLSMTHTFDPQGRWVAVTRLNLGPCTVTQVKSVDSDGYQAVQFAYGSRRRLTRQMAGHLVKSGVKLMPRQIREVRGSGGIHVGDTVTVSDVFREGDVVQVSGWTKGRGFTGVVKRWGFSGGPRTHGQSDRHRAPGSIGQGTDPGRVHKGKKMAGRHGNERRSIRNLKVVSVKPEIHEVWVSGAVPGHPHSPVVVKVTNPVKRQEGASDETVGH